MAISRLVPAYYSTVYGQLATGFPGAATGGTEVTSGGYKYHTFTSSGTLTVTSAGLFEVLVVGGGGGGAGTVVNTVFGGGGGAGALLNFSIYLAAGDQTVVVGAGGNSPTPASPPYGTADCGHNSSIGSVIAIGGGGSCRQSRGSSDARNGDGGCGAGSYTDSGGPRFNQGGHGFIGFDGGAGKQTSTSGGGGMGAAGDDAATAGSGYGGDGGAGLNTFSTWATATSTGDSGYYCGGGGGTGTTAAGSGGSGGGGAGNTAGAGTAGSANTGGGGGAGRGTNVKGGNGGSGIVIVRYAV